MMVGRVPSQEVVEMENGAADHGEDERARVGGVVDEVVEEIVLDDPEKLGVLPDGFASQFDGGVDEHKREELDVLVGADGSDAVGVVDDLAHVEERAEEVEDVDHAARSVAAGGGDHVVLRLRPLHRHLHVREAHEDGLDELVHRVAGAPLQEVAPVRRLLHHLEAGVDEGAHGVVGKEDRGAGAHDGREDLEHAHEDGVLRRAVGVLEAAVGDGEDDGVDGVAGAGGVLVEHVELEDLEDGGEGDAGGGRRHVVALHHVEEGGEIDGGVGGAPLAELAGVEQQGAEGLEGVEKVGIGGFVRGGDCRVVRAAHHRQDGAHLRVEHAGDADLPPPRHTAYDRALLHVGHRR